MVDDFLGDNDLFGASVLVVSSASSKTGLGVARQAANREGLRVVGLTSPANVSFTEGLGVYTEVIAYGDDLRHDMILGGTHHGDIVSMHQSD